MIASFITTVLAYLYVAMFVALYIILGVACTSNVPSTHTETPGQFDTCKTTCREHVRWSGK